VTQLPPQTVLSIGLFGGSFNPAHAGHMHVAKCGLNQLGLDRIWWMVSPQNPLKSKQPPYAQRVQSVIALNLPYAMRVSHMERDFGTTYTVDMLKRARETWPQTRFVFLMGADNFAQLPRWKHWQQIMRTVPVAVSIAILRRSGVDISDPADQSPVVDTPATGPSPRRHLSQSAAITVNIPLTFPSYRQGS